jgi:hypothetical protein
MEKHGIVLTATSNSRPLEWVVQGEKPIPDGAITAKPHRQEITDAALSSGLFMLISTGSPESGDPPRRCYSSALA